YKIVQPTFLYELLWNLVVFVVLIYVDRRFRMGHGRLFALYVAGYCIGRFGIELLRDDAATHIAGIRVNSFTSTFVFIGAVVYLLLAAKGREDPEAIRRGWQPEDSGEQELAVESEETAEPGAEPDGEAPDERDESDTLEVAAAGVEPPGDDKPSEVTSDEDEPAATAEDDESDAQAETELAESEPIQAVPDEAVPVEESEQSDTAEADPDPDPDSVESAEVEAVDDDTTDSAEPPADDTADDTADAEGEAGVIDEESDGADGEADASQDAEQRG
ncbi:prolipoprotein diacylglyceryl transferase family protein, partial [Mycolicibacter arupensis]